MPQATIQISKEAHKALLKIQYERRASGQKNVSLSKLVSEYLDKGLGVKTKV